jgi:hypothetical protein
MKTLRLGTQFVDDPTKGFIFVYGAEGGTTTTFANSIVKMLPADKKVYVLLTEPPHNATAPIKKHFPKEWQNDRFVLPMGEDGHSVFPVTTKAEILLYPSAVRKAGDAGAIIIDALDTLRLILFKHYESKEISFKAWGDADNDIVRMFLDFVTMDVPIIVIMKEKEETVVKASGGKIISIDKTGEIVPSFDKAKILRWASMKFHILRKGRFEVTKTKGMIEEGEKFSYTFKTEGKKNLYDQLTGTWLPDILRMMKVE